MTKATELRELASLTTISSGQIQFDTDIKISGDLITTGNTINITADTLNITDPNITIASGAANSALADGAGITIEGANATFTWDNASNSMNINKNLNINGAFDANGFITSDADGNSVRSGFFLGSSGHGIYRGSGTNDVHLYTTSGRVVINTDGAASTAGITVDDSNNVGIGITDPESKLHVDGDVRIASQGKIVFGSAGNPPGDYLEMWDTSGNPLFNVVQDSSSKFNVEGVTGDVWAKGSYSTDQVRHSVRPSVLMDFANSKKLHPSIAFTRSTTASYYDGKSKVKAEENLIPNSSNPGTWGRSRVNFPTTDGTQLVTGENAFKFVPDTQNGTHYLPQGSLTFTNTTRTISVYAKAGGYNFVGLGTYTYNGGRSGYVFNLTDGSYVACGTTGGMTNDQAGAQDLGNGWYRLFVTVTASTSSTYPMILIADQSSTSIIYGFAGDNTSGVYLYGFQMEDRANLTAYTETTSAPITKYQPQIQVAEANKPRFDHNPETGESKGLMIEEYAINYMAYSVPAASRFSGGIIMYDNYAIAPDGTLSAAHCQMTSSGSYTQTTQSVGSSSAKEYTFSFYIKQQGDNCSGVRMYYHESSPSNRIEATFNFDGTISGKINTGTVASNPSMATIEPVGNGWYRCSLSSTSDGSGATFVVNLRSANTTTYDITNTFLLWGLQLEHSKYNHVPTSYIGTTGVQASRSPEVATISGDVFAETISGQDITVYSHSVVSENYSWKNVNSTVYNLGPDRVQYRVDDTNGPEVLIFNPTFVAQVTNNDVSEREHKAAATYQINNVRMSQNGNTVVADTNAQWQPFTYMNLGRLESTEYLDGVIKKIAIYDSILSDAELQALTENN